MTNESEDLKYISPCISCLIFHYSEILREAIITALVLTNVIDYNNSSNKMRVALILADLVYKRIIFFKNHFSFLQLNRSIDYNRICLNWCIVSKYNAENIFIKNASESNLE